MSAKQRFDRRQWMLLSLLGIALIGNTVVTYYYFTIRVPGGNDSIPRYYGARAWLFEGLSPYSQAVGERGQIAIYGRLANDSGEDKAHFAYPFYAIFFYIPLAWLDWNWARAVGTVCTEAALAATALFSFRFNRWSPPAWLAAATLLWTLMFYHGARTIILWQFAAVSAVLIAGGLWAIHERRDVLAGITLALATAKPQMTFIIVPLIGLWSLSARRWRLAISLLGSMIVLCGLSFIFAPDWVAMMLRQIESYGSYTDIGSPINTLTRIVFPFLGQPVEWLLNLLLAGWLAWEWWQARLGEGKRFDWVVMLTLVITNLVALRTATTNYVMMTPTLVYLFARAANRWGGRAYIWIAAVEAVMFAGLWVLFAVTVKGRIEQWPMYLPLPLGLLAGLIACRPRSLA